MGGSPIGAEVRMDLHRSLGLERTSKVWKGKKRGSDIVTLTL